MKKLSVFTVLLSALTLTVAAQKKKLYLSQNPEWIEWADSPRIHPVPPEHATQPAIMLLNEVKIDYRVEGADIVKHTTLHRLIKVLDNRGIERYATIEVPLNRGTKVPTVEARVISPDGRIQQLSHKRLLYALNEKGTYSLILPTEGVGINSEIELLVKEINPKDNFGTVNFQFDIPVAKTHFLLTYRKNMSIDGKSFNGFPELTPEMEGSRMQYKVVLKEIPALLPEENSYYDLHRMQFRYRLSYYSPNESEEKIKLNTYNNLARKIWDENYEYSDKEMRAVNQFLTELGVHAGDDDEKKIRKIELGIKKHIVLYPYVDYEERREIEGVKEQRSMSLFAPGYEDPRQVLDTVLEKKAASYKGYVRLFAACLTQAGVRHNIGWAWERDEYLANVSFESWAGLNHTLIYFPSTHRFLSPTSKSLRYPVIPSGLAASKGVFCVMPPKGAIDGRMYRVRSINALSENESRSDINASLTFTKGMDAKVDIAHSWYGYDAAGVRTRLPMVRPENMQKYVAGLFDFVDNPAEVLSYSFSNDDVSNYNTNKPVVLTAKVDASGLINKAGYRYLINAGKLINDQVNMYDNRPRKTSVDVAYPNSSRHTITINIPKGYKILNPEAARISADYLNGDVETVISFTSDYKLVKDARNGDRLVITVEEMYKQLHFSTLEYERFRKVFNAAADFNNVTFVMVRK